MDGGKSSRSRDFNGSQTMTAPRNPDEAEDRLAPLRPGYLRRLTLRQAEVANAAAIAAARPFADDELRKFIAPRTAWAAAPPFTAICD